jgi:hypothetical protein
LAYLPYIILSTLWLALIAGFAVWLAIRAVKWKQGGSPKRLIAPVLSLMVVTGPLWAEAIKEEIDCRMAGLALSSPIAAAEEGLYWRSHESLSISYSGGIPYDQRRHLATLSLLRSLVEGRIGFLEVPYAPKGEGGGKETTNQKLYFARKGPQVECWLDPESTTDTRGFGYLARTLPPGTCVAWEQTGGTGARFEMHARSSVRAIAIKDRKADKDVASYWYAAVDKEETILRLYGIRKLRPVSCTPDRLDGKPAVHLAEMLFPAADGKVVSREDLARHAGEPWRPVTLNEKREEAVPAGQAGIGYWIARNRVRKLTRDDIDLWKSATRGYRAPIAHLTFGRAYLVTGPMRFPTDLYGANLVDWVLEKGAPIPPGPRGHGNIYRIGEGCIWGSCEKDATNR